MTCIDATRSLKLKQRLNHKDIEQTCNTLTPHAKHPTYFIIFHPQLKVFLFVMLTHHSTI